MGRELKFVTALHKNTKRDYIARMMGDKPACMKVAGRFGAKYWDGERKYGYGGYVYDGRWAIIAKKLISKYNLREDARILDVGCGKGFLLYEFRKALPYCNITGIDISSYAVKNAVKEVRSHIFVRTAQEPLVFCSKSFDLVVSVTTLHNLPIYALMDALQEIERVGKDKYIVVESFRNEQELFNLQCWALTCRSFFKKEEWEWLFGEFGYAGDYEFIYFE